MIHILVVVRVPEMVPVLLFLVAPSSMIRKMCRSAHASFPIFPNCVALFQKGLFRSSRSGIGGDISRSRPSTKC
jgi:hypothetical protein